MSRGGRWKTKIESPPTPKCGRWRSSVTSQDHDSVTTPKNAAESETKVSSFFDWALDQLFNRKQDQCNEVTTDLSKESHEDTLVKAFLQPFFFDGGMQHYERRENKDAHFAMTWAAVMSPWTIISAFHRILDVMADVMNLPQDKLDAKWQKAAQRFAGTLATLFHRSTKYASGEWKPDDPLHSLDQIWQSEIFQKELAGWKGYQESTQATGRFARHICQWEIGYPHANAAINGKKLVLYGKEWKWPKNMADFNEMRDLLMRVSADNLEVYAAMLDEDGRHADAKEVRALEKPKDRHSYYHKKQIDEAFRAYFGLKKPRKTKVGKAAKPKKIKGRRLG